MSSCRNLFKAVRGLCSSPREQPTTGDENTKDQGDQHTGGQQGVMVPPPPVLAEHHDRDVPVLGIEFPENVIRFTRGVVLAAITDQQPIGKGTTANVYRGLLGGRDTAIKCIEKEYASQFEDELKVACRCNHPRIVKFIGYCLDGEQRVIVYDFLRGGSLDTLISRQGQYARHPPLAWKKRLELSLAILDGIRYLQEEIEGETAIVHVDLKPENILLDESLNPYIADFGASVTIQKGDIDATTEKKEFLGTVGYMDVAIYNQGSVSLGTDIFSFGSILLDLVMGRDLQPKKMDRIITPDYVTEIMDPCLKNDQQIPVEEVMEVVLLVSRCRMDERESRPRLEEVIDCLTRIKNR